MIDRPVLARILIYPFKGLDPVELSETTISKKGSLKHDREFVLFDEAGNIVSCKRDKKLHRVRSFVDLERESISLSYEGKSWSFGFSELNAIGELFSEILGYKVSVKRFSEGGLPDDREAHGPTLVSTATLKEVARWFSLPLEEVRRRFRTNLEIDGVPPFWEDRLVGADSGKKFSIGDALFIGARISKRCPVPTRNPFTGQELKGFVKTFVEKRKETLPMWSPREGFSDTYYRLCINTAVPEGQEGKKLKVGDLLEL